MSLQDVLGQGAESTQTHKNTFHLLLSSLSCTNEKVVYFLFSLLASPLDEGPIICNTNLNINL